MIRFGLYATYDKLAKTIGEPFLSVNDEVAKRRFEQTREKMKELKMEVGDITVLNLGYIEMNIKANYDYDRRITSYEPNITKNDEIYDIYNPFMDIKIRKNNPEEEKEELKTIERDKEEIESMEYRNGRKGIYLGKGKEIKE